MSILKVIRAWFNSPERQCRIYGHYMWLGNIGSHHSDGKLHWPCSRCGKVQVLDYGLQASGSIRQAPYEPRKGDKS